MITFGTLSWSNVVSTLVALNAELSWQHLIQRDEVPVIAAGVSLLVLVVALHTAYVFLSLDVFLASVCASRPSVVG